VIKVSNMDSVNVPVWLSLGTAVALCFSVLCLRAQSTQSRGIADGGPATKATLLGPTGLAVDESNLYIVESGRRRIRRVNLKTGIITTVAGGGSRCLEEGNTSPRPGCLGSPQRVAVDHFGNVYVTDEDDGRVIKVNVEVHSFTVVAAGKIKLSHDSGYEKTAELEWPAGIAIDPSGGLFFADKATHTIYRLALHPNSLGIILGTGGQGFKGDGGPSKDAELRFPDGLARDEQENLFVADSDNCRIQRIDGKTGIVTTLAGTEEGGSTCEQLPPAGATREKPTDVAVGQNGTVFFLQTDRDRVRRFDTLTGSVSTVAGNGESGFSGDGGLATAAALHHPEGIAIDKDGNLYISDTHNNRVRRVDVKTGTITTIAGKGPVSPDIDL
jgi:sugar lactone lactonase YvrE